MTTEEAAAAAEETMATVPEKEKEIAEDTSEDEIFNFQNLVGQELMKVEKEELKDMPYPADINQGHYSSVVSTMRN
jgi:superfamily I DNA and/or RNA helicase